MSTWLPTISRGPCSPRNNAICYAPVVNIVPEGPGVYVASGFSLPTLQAAFDKLQEELTKLFKEGDTIRVDREHYNTVADAMAAILTKYGNIAPTAAWPVN